MDHLKETPSAARCRLFKQSLMFFAAAWGYIPAGMAMTWPNTLASDIVIDNATFFGSQLSFTNVQLDLVSSMMFIGSLPGFLSAGWLVHAIGRRRSMVVSAIPGLVGSLLIALSVNNEMIYAGRCLEGMAFGLMSVAVRPYIIEIADTEIRGSAFAVSNFMQQFGSIAAVSLGMPFKWYQVSLFSAGSYAVFIFLMVPFLPESPTHLVVKGKTEKAKDILRRLRGPSVDVDEVLMDLQKQNEFSQNSNGWSFLLKPSIVKIELILFGLFFISNFAGVEVIKANASRILQSSGLALDKDLGAIFVTCILFCGNFAMMLVVDRLGRRPCLMISLSTVAVAYSILGAFVYLTQAESETFEMVEINLMVDANASAPYLVDNVPTTPAMDWNWVPLACLMLAALGQAFGMGPIPWLLSSEYFPTSIRSQGMCVSTLVGNLETFLAMVLFSPMQEALTQAGHYWSYASFALVGVPYTFFLIKETKGKNVG